MVLRPAATTPFRAWTKSYETRPRSVLVFAYVECVEPGGHFERGRKHDGVFRTHEMHTHTEKHSERLQRKWSSPLSSDQTFAVELLTRFRADWMESKLSDTIGRTFCRTFLEWPLTIAGHLHCSLDIVVYCSFTYKFRFITYENASNPIIDYESGCSRNARNLHKSHSGPWKRVRQI